MSDAEPKSTSTMSPDTESVNGESSHVAVSEENLAALLRATLNSTDPELERRAEPAPAAPVSDVTVAPLAHPASSVVESRLALFAAVKENRSAISRSGNIPTKPLIDQPPPANANTTVILRETVPLVPASVRSIASPSLNTPNTPRTRLIVGLVIGAVIAAGGVSIFLMRARSSAAPVAVTSAPKDNVPPQVAVEPPLQVRVEPLGNGLIDVRWNPQSAAIAQARDGRLVITEHNQQPRTLALQAEQLKTGHLTYQSTAESVEFDLEVVDRSGATAKESILALQAPLSSPQPARTAPQTQPGNTATPNVQNIANLGAPPDAPQASQPKIRTFVPPAAQHNVEQRAIIDAPPALTNGTTMPLAVGLPVTPAAIPPPPKINAPVEQQVRVESSIEAANLIKKVIPVYPQLARSTHIQGIVRFTAHIGKDGHILDLKFASGPPVLVEPASAAVKQWIYRPTLLNGKPVEVITQIDVNFTLH